MASQHEHIFTVGNTDYDVFKRLFPALMADRWRELLSTITGRPIVNENPESRESRIAECNERIAHYDAIVASQRPSGWRHVNV